MPIGVITGSDMIEKIIDITLEILMGALIIGVVGRFVCGVLMGIWVDIRGKD